MLLHRIVILFCKYIVAIHSKLHSDSRPIRVSEMDIRILLPLFSEAKEAY